MNSFSFLKFGVSPVIYNRGVFYCIERDFAYLCREFLENLDNMELRVDRKWKKEDYTVGRLFVDGEFFCNTMEDTDRGLDQDMQDFMIRSRKIPNRTAVPTGRYKVLMNTVSPKFSKYPFYMEVCQGKLPRLKDVKGFDGILIHCADGQNGHKLVSGCIGVGLNTIRGGLTDGKRIFKEIYAKLKEAHTRGEAIYITIE